MEEAREEDRRRAMEQRLSGGKAGGGAAGGSGEGEGRPPSSGGWTSEQGGAPPPSSSSSPPPPSSSSLSSAVDAPRVGMWGAVDHVERKRMDGESKTSKWGLVRSAAGFGSAADSEHAAASSVGGSGWAGLYAALSLGGSGGSEGVGGGGLHAAQAREAKEAKERLGALDHNILDMWHPVKPTQAQLDMSEATGVPVPPLGAVRIRTWIKRNEAVLAAIEAARQQEMKELQRRANLEAAGGVTSGSIDSEPSAARGGGESIQSFDGIETEAL